MDVGPLVVHGDVDAVALEYLGHTVFPEHVLHKIHSIGTCLVPDTLLSTLKGMSNEF